MGPAFQIEARLSVSFALVLTSIAFKFTLIQLIPPIAYLTILDEYVFFCYCAVVVVAAEAPIIASREIVPRQDQIRVDRICGFWLATLVVAGHIFFAWRFLQARMTQLRLLGECYRVVGAMSKTLAKIDAETPKPAAEPKPKGQKQRRLASLMISSELESNDVYTTKQVDDHFLCALSRRRGQLVDTVGNAVAHAFDTATHAVDKAKSAL
eukprot:735246-Prymnesium_polylepis.1